MKYRTLFFIIFVFASLCSHAAGDKSVYDRVNTFSVAKPVWPKDRETEKNMTVSFRKIFNVGKVDSAVLCITASTNYRVYVNGRFLAHGPCVAAHDYYRIDAYDMLSMLNKGENVISIEVCGYNTNSYYLLDQPSFLQAEVKINDAIVAATGTANLDFTAYVLNQRKQDVPRFSYQRPFTEHYILSPNYDGWITDIAWKDSVSMVLCTEQPEKKLLVRGVPYPDYSLLTNVSQVSDSVYAFEKNSTGFIGFTAHVKTPVKLKVAFDELITPEGDVDDKRLNCNNYIIYELLPGDYTLESFEPYTLKYLKITVLEGEDFEVGNICMRCYVNSDVSRATFVSNNDSLNFLFEAARETHRQNALDVFMDCPSRERAGWLCDSYFSSRVAFDLSGYTRIERNFFENFLLPDTFKNLPKGMLPMCYPSDHTDLNFIPNWAMWFVLELEEYQQRSGNREMIEALKPKVYALIDYFKLFKNSDRLLEKLDKWVFVEWSKANDFVQDVNYPTNMLYAAMLDAAGNIYGDRQLNNEAILVREAVRNQSFDGSFFRDNAIRKNGKLEVQNNYTEVCQYYAFYFNVATPKTYPDLWKCLLTEFGPKRKTDNRYPSVYFANAFVGNYLRLELLSRYGYVRQLMNESLAEYLIMAETTGTLWENMTAVASCNHGFASHVAHVFYRDLLGVQSITPKKKKIVIRFTDNDLQSCRGDIPVGDEFVSLKWEKKSNTIYYSIRTPKGYDTTVENASKCALVKQN